MFNKKSFITAAFVDQNRRYVEVLYRHDDEVHPFVVDLEDKKNPDTKRLLKLYSMDDLHEQTYQNKKDERKAFEDIVMNIAQKSGILQIEDLVKGFYKILFEEIEKEKLFNLKLEAFNLKFVKDASKTIKSKIRKCSSVLEMVKILIKLKETKK